MGRKRCPARPEEFQQAVITKFTRGRQGKTFHSRAVAQFEADKDILPITAVLDGSEITLWASWATPRRGKLRHRSAPRVDLEPEVTAVELPSGTGGLSMRPFTTVIFKA